MRGLGRAGWDVDVVTSAPGFSSRSRYARRVFTTPPLEQGLDGWTAAVARAATAGDHELVLAGGDAETFALSYVRDQLPCTVPYPPHEVVLRTLDKRGVGEQAAQAGLAVPAAHVPTSAAEVADLPPPYVVKSSAHWRPDRDADELRWETVVTPDADEAWRRVAQIRDGGGDPFVQHHVEGALYALSVLVDPDGEVVGAVRSVGPARTWPAEAGMRVRSRTLPIDHDELERAARLLHGLGWWGLADLDFLAPPDGPPQLIDLNGRLYGSLSIALAAGVNFPDLWARLATGRDAPRGVLGRPGERFHWLEGDLRRARAEQRGGLVDDVLGCLLWAPGAAHSIWAADDPLPALRFGADLVGRGLRGAVTRGPGGR